MHKIKKLLCVALSLIMVASCAGIGVSAADDKHIGEKGMLEVMSYDLNSIRLNDVIDQAVAVLDVAVIGSVVNAIGCDVVATQEDFDIRWEDYPIGVDVPEFHEIFVGSMTNYANVTAEVDTESLGGIVDSILGTEPEVIERHQTLAGGDGLGIYSKYAIYNTYRQKWEKSDHRLDNGTPLLYDTGFVVTSIEIADGYFVDIYNVSTDEHESSVEARQAQLEQLAAIAKAICK